MVRSNGSDGGCAQFNKPGTYSPIGYSGESPIATHYDSELHGRLARYARERTQSIDYYDLLATIQTDILRVAQPRHASSISPNG